MMSRRPALELRAERYAVFGAAGTVPAISSAIETPTSLYQVHLVIIMLYSTLIGTSARCQAIFGILLASL